MSEEHQLPSDSDEDDEDYVPNGTDIDLVSEVESEGDVESSPEDENDENKRQTGPKKRSKGRRNKNSKRARTKPRASEDEGKEEEECKAKKELTEEEEKKRADSLWADFMKDTAVVSKEKPQNSINKSNERSPPTQKPKVQEKVKITKVFEFAGEEVKIEKEVAVDSAEARLSLSAAENSAKPSPESASPTPVPRGRGRGGARRVGLSGISSVLGQIGKKSKISTLEKSKLDWDNFKKQENIEEEINSHNRGKDGYLERQDFLQRADLRQFEIEKQLRNTSRRTTR
ncbi:craniofacial development protein 1 [Ooceraea biroi]|uniref:craniofacial development protein 1 n=1 Tax=Ooceraea biroi TaxID=2015173 RepID=UPI0005B8BCC6|nr:craniofacial development protein 1 [Ooceraea biroi]XP_011352666.1 craniofacial development protein 1 [Ooceraea biroi]XP_011352667.1 craniofacial development protein 1 [Ooceraea biroi]